MTKSTITREQAQKIIVAADEVITALAGTNEDVHPDDSKKMCELWDDLNDRHAPPVVVRELARMALAAMDSEPVAYMYRDNLHSVARFSLESKIGNWSPEDINEYEISETPLYRHAQPVPVVMVDLLSMAASAIEDLLEHTDPNTSYYSGVWADVPGKLRAAMLQAGNSPVIPDGYVMVPKEPTEEMNEAGWAAMNEHYAINPTYRAMLAAAPQEVKP